MKYILTDMSPEVKAAKERAEKARYMLKIGAIDLDEAKAACQPYIDMVNEGARRMSKQFGNPFRSVTTTGFLR